MAINFEGKVVLITGVAPGGLGEAYADMFASRGATLVLNDLGVDWAGEPTQAGAVAVAERLSAAGHAVSAVHGDIFTDHEKIVSAAIERHGHLDVLVNNAGAGGDFEKMLDVHVTGTHRMSETAWPHLAASGAGRIINTASNATWSSDGPPAYGTAKSAVIALTRFQARNGRHVGIKSNVVLPSAWANSTAGLPDEALAYFLEKRFGPEHVAGFVAYLAHQTTQLTGMAFSVAGGVVARVVQAKNHGHFDLSANPDVWAANEDNFTGLDGLSVPPSMWGDVQMLAERIGPDAAAELAKANLDMLGGV